MKQTITHDLDQELARKAANAALKQYQTRFPTAQIHAQWQGPDQAVVEMKLRGFTLKPRISLRPHAIDVEIDIPLLARPFEGKARALIERELAVWLQRAKNGELETPAV